MNILSSPILSPRPPVVVVMGHIDHGKSKILDYIRKSNIVDKEAGGITQHIGAYEVESNGHRITFIDTPGHEAFSAMRARGAKVADIAVLVVSADEGVKPQTLDAHKAIEEAGIPYIVAINKMDRPNANPEMVKGQLAENNILVESYGGKIPSVNISATTGENVEELLDNIILLSEIAELKADPNIPASGIVIESNLDPKKGISATLIIQNGSLKKGQYIVSGESMAPLRILENFEGKAISEASFSSPIRVIGFNKNPQVGESFAVTEDKKEAESFANASIEGKNLLKEITIRKSKINESLETMEINLPLVLKADTVGSLEALEHELRKISVLGIKIFTLRSGVGNIGEADIKFALTEKNSAVVAGFNVSIDSSTKNYAEQVKIPIIMGDVIYKLAEEIEKTAKVKSAEIERNEVTGTMKVLRIFSKSKKNQVIGGTVVAGKVLPGKVFVLKRRGEEIGKGKFVTLQHNKTNTSEVSEGQEFGAMVETKIEIAIGDELEITEKSKIQK